MSTQRLEREEIHFGFPCAAGTEIDSVERSGTLARDVVHRGVALPAASTFWHDIDFGFLGACLARSTRVHGIEVAAESRLEFPPFFVSHWWHPLLLPLWPWAAFRSWRTVVNGTVTVTPSTDSSLRVGAVDLEIRAGDRFGCDRHGVRDLLLSSPRDVAGERLETGWLTFDRAGTLKQITFYRSQDFRGHPVFGSGLAGTEVRLFPNGRLRRFVLSRDAVVDNRRWTRGTRLDLDARGRVLATKSINVDVMLYSFRPAIAHLARHDDGEDSE